MLPKPNRAAHAPSDRSAFPLVLDAALHECATTESRQIRHPADFLHAVRWAVAQGLHPRATASTVAVAEKLAAKMNREGHLAYARDRTAAELQVSVSTVRNHTRILRELGLLVWVEHGSRRNILRTKNPLLRPTAYKATATIFAAVAPQYWDRAMGRTTAGHGYTARLVAVDDLGRAYETALAHLARTPAESRRAERRCPPSVSGFSRSRSYRNKGGNNYTRTRATNTPSQPNQQAATPAVNPSKLSELIAAAEHIQTAVPWLAHVCSRRLAFQLRERLLATADLSPLIRELRSLTSGGVRRPLGFLAAHLTRTKTEAHRVDTPLAWVPVQPATPSPVALPRFAPEAAVNPAHFDGDPALWEQWDADCAQRAFAEALERWRDQERQALLLQDLVPVYPVVEIPVDDAGARWEAMIEQRRKAHSGPFERSAPLRAQLRSQWSMRRLNR